MKALLLALALLWSLPASAQFNGCAPGLCNKASNYVGPLDIVPSATAFYSLRCGSTALATGTTKVVNVREAKTNSTTDIVCLSNGNFDTATAAAFAPLDVTGTGAITGTALTFTGGHVNDTVTGGTVAPGTYIVSGASPAWTVNISQTVVSSTLTLTYALFVTKWYDQSGNIKDASQGTAANQPHLLLNVLSNRPAVLFAATSPALAAVIASVIQPFTFSAVGERTAAFTSFVPLWLNNAAGFPFFGFQNSANLVRFNNGTPQTASAADSAPHAIQAIANGATSSINVDGSSTGNVNTGTTATGTDVELGYGFTGYEFEIGLFPSGFSAGIQASMNANQRAYWGF